MLTTVFTKTLRDQRRSLLGWSIGIAGTVALMAAIWPSFADMDIDAMMAEYPEDLKEAFNITDLSTGVGYLNAELFSFMIPIMFIVFAVGRGGRLVAGEEEDGTLETLATLPLTRTRVLLEKAAALVVGIGVLTIVLWASLVLGSAVVDMGIGPLEALNGALAMFCFGLEFGLIALAVSAGTGRRALAVGVTSAVAGLSYLLFLMGRLVDAFEPYLVLSPFHQALSEGPLGPDLPPIMATMVATGLVALVASVPVFHHRDLAT
ncbi:MAG: ABC transporter permease [Acidimicrobiales bacterium]|jgi:ABC-2 type transport system permease protein|nr:ABC transporter permease [Acidimicrobiales bacterium]